MADNASRTNRRKTGAIGEEKAVVYLVTQGYHIIKLNWRCRTGEIDIIAGHADVIVFIEVRSRTSKGRYGTAAESVTVRKQQQVRETAQVYLKTSSSYKAKVRFDVITVYLDADNDAVEMSHIQHAF
ncbi:hypothetical protein SY83_15935 [Paenibacillus swuensis]|uniref:UPF0102 protein SY83_15935 n=1 Tax=Paenibacillus swuensis TaxID=1178515 RepID=A0A172TL70_9BACL|nr:YraN family protein [Paenibacillus swuensis]ANE47523.1 hypothetical protein SY83_15935 [Paenibacillus swuensis]